MDTLYGDVGGEEQRVGAMKNRHVVPDPDLTAPGRADSPL
jgi:hypothetical protein